jgi:uncharacterized protein
LILAITPPPPHPGFEWDEGKRASNLAKHGVDFRRAVQIFDTPTFERPDRRRDYGELRIRCLGEIDGRIYNVVYTWRGLVRRIISARKANAREQRTYYARHA